MKTRLFFIISIVFFSNQLFSQMKIVALHSPTNGVQYFSNEGNVQPLQLAYTAAVDGDTIYIPGGTFAQPSLYDKRLTIYGAGHFPSSTEATGKTILSSNFSLGEMADDFHLEGVEITGNILFAAAAAVDNLVVKRCKFGDLNANSQYSNNALFVENIFSSGNVEKLVGAQFFNNIIIYAITYAQTLIFLNNLFLHNGSAQVLNYANSCVVNNNIFTNSSYGYITNGQSNSFNRNIYTHGNSNFGTDPILGDNYLMTWTDIFVNFPGGSFNYAHDYHLTAAALAFLGTDGTEIGIFGGAVPFKTESIPVNPHITSAVISNESTAGQINVNIQVQAQTR